MSVTPYVVGQWVRAEKFYGRGELIDEILHGNRNWLWLLGTRRIGKTSLLKEIELLSVQRPELGYFPMFWDFQGANDPDELHATFRDSLEDADADGRLDDLGIAMDEVDNDDLFRSIGRLRRNLRSKGKKLLLLCDEVEELIKLNEEDPSLLRRLRRAMQSQEDIRSVLASTIRLWALSDERGDTSPFLHGFTPPMYIHNLDDDEARSLVRQAQLPTETRPQIPDDAVEAIRTHCDNHPYLLQLTGKRYLEIGDLEEAIEQVAADPMVSYFFSVDFEMLSATERSVLRIIADQQTSTSDSIQERIAVDSGSLGGHLHRLQHLGYIRRIPKGGFILVNQFFSRWFTELPADLSAQPQPGDQEATVKLDSESSTMTLDVFDSRYRLQAKIGRGATGLVYKAYDTLLRVHIAIKLLRPEYAANEEAVERLRREVLLARDLAHPNIVKIYHLGSYQDKQYVTMQWVDGPTLSKVLAKKGTLPIDRTVYLAKRIASALETAHAARVLHRDIKPQNILIDSAGEPHVTDFGLARVVGEPGMTSHGIFLGTPHYASPEQCRMEELDSRSDLYSLGVVMFEMATGRSLFTSKTTRGLLEMHLKTPAPSPRDVRSDLPSDLSALILRCLEKDPADRCQTAAELLEALESVGSPEDTRW